VDVEMKKLYTLEGDRVYDVTLTEDAMIHEMSKWMNIKSMCFVECGFMFGRKNLKMFLIELKKVMMLTSSILENHVSEN
jgi:hypothetical protein